MTTTGATTGTEPSPASRDDGFRLEPGTDARPATAPQRMGDRLWGPMLGLGLVGFAAGLVLAIVRADVVSDADAARADDVAALGHLVPGLLFLGFFGVLTGVSFAIARILGVFREGGGAVQSELGVPVQTLRLPTTGRAFMVLMMIGAITSLFAVTAHIVVAFTVPSLDPADLTRSAQWATALGGLRRIAAATYLLGISLGLATVIHVIRFQTVRVRELASST